MSIDLSPKETYSIGELAELSGLSVHTVRWYESQGLFPRDVPRTSGGRRYYTEEALVWLSFITRLRESGMPIADIARYSDLVRAGDGNEDARIALMQGHANALSDQMRALAVCHEVITTKIALYRSALAARNQRSSGSAGAAD